MKTIKKYLIKTPFQLDKLLLLLVIFLLFAKQNAHAQEIDPNAYYRLTTQWQGEGKSLDVINDGTNNSLWLGQTGPYSGQLWKFTPVGNGYYRITSQWQGANKSIDIINDGRNNNQPVLAKTGPYTGQFWKLTPLGNGFFRLTCQWQGDVKSLDILNDGRNNNKPILTKTGPYTGQFWKIVRVQ